jgi:putative endonuclease
MWSAGYGSASQGHSATLPDMSFSYVHILRSESSPERFRVGLTEDLQERLRKHNAGEIAHTAKFRPWTVKTAIAFREHACAAEFERHLKCGSGRAFAKRHF